MTICNARALEKIANEPKYTHARYFPILRLGKFAKRYPDVIVSLEQIAHEDGPQLAYALHALRLARAWKYEEIAKRAMTSSNDFVREEARKYLRALEKRHASTGSASHGNVPR